MNKMAVIDPEIVEEVTIIGRVVRDFAANIATSFKGDTGKKVLKSFSVQDGVMVIGLLGRAAAAARGSKNPRAAMTSLAAAGGIIGKRVLENVSPMELAQHIPASALDPKVAKIARKYGQKDFADMLDLVSGRAFGNNNDGDKPEDPKSADKPKADKPDEPKGPDFPPVDRRRPVAAQPRI
ncbi:MAG: hypothetical protein Alpg2KO_19970 [Alphaproteobacteria bacterium]